MAKKNAAASNKPAKVKKGKEQEVPDDPELHERIMSAGEASRLLNKSGLAVAYLVARDGMDEELAASIVEGLDSEQLHELVTEALIAPDPNLCPDCRHPLRGHRNSDEFDGCDVEGCSCMRLSGSTVPRRAGGQLVPDERKPGEPKHEYIDLFTVDGLMSDPEDVPTLIQSCIDEARAKNKHEAVYKANKKRLITKLDAAVAPHVLFGDVKLDRYQGHTVTLSEQKLLEKGVSPDIINECWQDTPYEDIRFTVPKGGK